MSDPDLQFLRQCNNEDLAPLVEYILKASSERLSAQDAYKNHCGDHRRYVREIEAEILSFGGNSLVNLFRGRGVPYLEVARDVAGKLRAKVKDESAVENVEWKVLEKLLERTLKGMSPADRTELLENLGKLGFKGVDLPGPGPVAALLVQGAIRAGGFQAYQLMVIVANAVAKQMLGHGLAFAANAALMRAVAVAVGPVGWAVTGLWTAIDLAGPAYRVTIPCVVHISMLRQKVLAGDL